MGTLKIDDIEYDYDENAEFEKDGKTYNFVSLKKTTTMKGGGKKYQNLTVRQKDLAKFKAWLKKELSGVGTDEDIPY